MASLTDFKSRLTGGGVRGNQFRVIFSFPTNHLTIADGNQARDDMEFLCTATGLPAQNIGTTDVKFRGRTLHLAGDSRTFEDWSITVLNDDFTILRAFEQWQEGIYSMLTNNGAVNPDHYKSSGSVEQLDRAGQPIKSYKFEGVFPTSIGAVALSMDTDDTIETFDVTLAVDYFTTADGSQ